MARPRYKVDLENVLSGATTYKEHLQTVEDGAPFWVHRWLLLLQSTCRIIRFGSFFLVYLTHWSFCIDVMSILLQNSRDYIYLQH